MELIADFEVQAATQEDASVLAKLIVIAGDGLPLRIWEMMREGDQDVMDVGTARAAREEGGFSFRNADVIRLNDEIASVIVSYPLLDRTSQDDINRAPSLFHPLLELENLAVPSYYINVLATFPHARGLGAATSLLHSMEQKARRANHSQLSLITGDINPARRLYERFGFRAMARRRISKDGWDYAGDEWLLYIKDL